MQRFFQPTAVLALAALALAAAPAAQAQNSIGVNFTGTDSSGGTFPLLDGTAAGFVTDTHWNDADGNAGTFDPAYLFDSTGHTTGAGFTFSAPDLSSSLSDASQGGSYLLTKGYADINPPAPPAPGASLPGITFSAVPYKTYDVYVYLDGATAGTATYTLGTAAQTVMNGTAFNGTFQKATASTPGDYLVFSGLTGANFTLSGVSTTSAPVDGVQVVDAAPVPESSPAVSLGLLLALGAGGLTLRAARRRA